MQRVLTCIVIVVWCGRFGECNDGKPVNSATQQPDRIIGPVDDTSRPREAGAVRNDNFLQMMLAWAPPGRFVMGLVRPNHYVPNHEQPVEVEHTRGFWIAHTEITQSQWQRVMQTTPWKGKFNVVSGDNYPAVYVSWNRAREFCERLTRSEHTAGRLKGNWEYSLPTEAEWEYACRAGSKTLYSFGDNEDDLDKYAWWSNNTKAERFAHKVGRKLPNKWGLYDMHGNAREWCIDGFVETLPGQRDPVIVAEETRIVRGGAWKASIYFSGSRNVSTLAEANAFTSFRPVLVHRRNIAWGQSDLTAVDEFEDVEY